MPYVIGLGTSVTGFGIGIQSINLTYNPQIQRLYSLGSPTPFDRNIINQKSLQITKYAPGTSVPLPPSVDCSDASSFLINIDASTCPARILDSTNWWVTSYSYSKDIQGWGTESWSLMSKPEVISGGGAEALMLRGVAEGQSSSNGGANTGVTFIGTTVAGLNLQVAAGSPGIGKTFDVVYGEVTSIGGGTGKSDGNEGQASVNIPITTIFVPA